MGQVGIYGQWERCRRGWKIMKRNLVMYQAWLDIKVGRILDKLPNQNFLLKLDLAGQNQNQGQGLIENKAREARVKFWSKRESLSVCISDFFKHFPKTTCFRILLIIQILVLLSRFHESNPLPTGPQNIYFYHAPLRDFNAH